MKYLLPSIIFITFSFVLSCRSAKKIQTATTPKDTTATTAPTVAIAPAVNDSKADSTNLTREIFNKLGSRKIDFKTFSAKLKVGYTDKEGPGPELTVFVRMQKDSVIWLSINATVFSYEAFRVLITRDSIKILNKKDKQAQYRSLSYLQELTKLPFDFSTLQDLIIGNPVYLDSNNVSLKQNETAISLLSKGKFFKNLLTLSKTDFVLQHSKLDDIDSTRNRSCDLVYADYEDKNNLLFSATRKIMVTEKTKLDIDMNFKQYSFNEILSYPFTIPKNYKRN